MKLIMQFSLWNFLYYAGFLWLGFVSPLQPTSPEEHPSSAVCDFLFNIFTTNLQSGGHLQPQQEYMPYHGDKVLI